VDDDVVDGKKVLVVHYGFRLRMVESTSMSQPKNSLMEARLSIVCLTVERRTWRILSGHCPLSE
jgi:hypothetical protein